MLPESSFEEEIKKARVERWERWLVAVPILTWCLLYFLPGGTFARAATLSFVSALIGMVVAWRFAPRVVKAFATIIAWVVGIVATCVLTTVARDAHLLEWIGLGFLLSGVLVLFGYMFLWGARGART